jgi:hypothetical protein
MVQQPRPQGDAGMRLQRLAGREIVEFEFRGEDVHWNREQRWCHHLAEDRLDARFRLQVPGPHPDLVARVIAGRKERQAVAMVEMGMRVEQVEVARMTAPHQLVA